VLSIYAVYRPGRICPTEPELASACLRADSWNKRFIWISVGMWAVGFLAAYTLPLWMQSS
jgi:mercuric ion transport protein